VVRGEERVFLRSAVSPGSTTAVTHSPFPESS
jgi:hypothetical protein